MAYVQFNNFKPGLDTRRSELTSLPGTLSTLQNAHINQGGEIEKRKAFAPNYLSSGQGLAFNQALPTANTILVFGSISNLVFALNSVVVQVPVPNQLFTTVVYVSGSVSPGQTVSITNCNISGLDGNYTVDTFIPSGGYAFLILNSVNNLPIVNQSATGSVNTIILPSTFTYQQLKDPSGTGLYMTSVVSATLFNGLAFVAAKFSDGDTYCFYNAVLVEDFIAGLVLPWNNTDVEIANALVALVNATSVTGTKGKPYTASIGASTNIVDIFSTPNLTTSTPFSATVSTTLESGSTGAINQTSFSAGTPESPAISAVGSFAIVMGHQNTQATGTLNGSATQNVASGDTVTIGGFTYIFEAAVSSAFSVLIGGTCDSSYTNLAAAVNLSAGMGSVYGNGTSANTQVTAGSVSSHNLVVMAIEGGTPGNSISVSANSSVSTSPLYPSNNPWGVGVTTLTNGGPDISQIKQVAVSGTNLLATEVPFVLNVNSTAQAVSSAINSNAVNTGYTAQANQNSVLIYSPTTTPNSYNNDVVSVTSGNPTGNSGNAGDVCIANCSFAVTAITASQDISAITVNGINILPSTQTYTSGTINSFLVAVASAISNYSETSGYLASASNNVLYISPLVVTSADGQPTITVTATCTIGTGASTALAASLSQTVLTFNLLGGSSFSTITQNLLTILTAPAVTCIAGGGVPGYSYSWYYSGGGTSQITCASPNSSSTQFDPPSSGSGSFSESWICQVTDSALDVVASPTLVINVIY